MPTIELSDRDATMLAEELESYLDDLKTERVRTDNRELHASFIEREKLVAGVIFRLKTGM